MSGKQRARIVTDQNAKLDFGDLKRKNMFIHLEFSDTRLPGDTQL